MGKPDEACKILSFDHIVFWVANAKMAANYYVSRLGFRPLATREPTEASKTLAYAVRLNQIVLVFESPTEAGGEADSELGRHGDFVKDIAMAVEDINLAVKGKPDEACKILSFDHIVFWVANAKMAANYYVSRLGFRPLATREPTEASKTLAYAVRLNQIVLVFESPTEAGGEADSELGRHGDFVKDIAMAVEDINLAVKVAREGGAEVLSEPLQQADESGVVTTAVLKTYGDNTHTLIDRSQYEGVFLPGFKQSKDDVFNEILPTPELLYVDHVESNMADGDLEDSIAWYERNLQMHRFWCVDYERDLTPYSCIRSLSVANEDETVLLQLNEGAKGLRPSNKATDYVRCHGGPGVEHVALYTSDILAAMRNLKARGAEVVEWPSTYYDIVRENLKDSPLKVKEELSELQQWNVLIDHDAAGYMLQAFTKHTQPRATIFLEILQRSPNFKGYGAGNYKIVFEALERLEAAKGKAESD